MADQTTGMISGPGPKSLAAFTLDTITDAQKNRLPVERKWLSNLRDSVPEVIRPSVAGLNEQWQQAEGAESWQSRSRIGVTAQKIQAACDFCDDILYKHGDIPFMCSVGSEISEQAPAFVTTQDPGAMLSLPRPSPGTDQPNPGAVRRIAAAVMSRMGISQPPPTEAQNEVTEEAVEKFMDDRQKKCDGVRQKQRLFRDRATYGVSYIHVIGIEDLTTPSGIRFGDEAANVWECYPDEENDGALDKGEFFFRTQRRASWRIWQDAVNSPEWTGSDGERVGVYFDMAMLRAALMSSPPMPGSGTSATVATPSIHQGGTPEMSDIISRQKTTDITEFWGWVPYTVAKEFEETTPGCIKHFSLPEVAAKFDPAVSIEGSAVPFYAEQRVWCLRYVVNGRMVGYIPNPGPLPYHREVWTDMSGVRFGVGVADLNHDHQHTLDGLCKALDDSLKFVTKLVFAVIDGKMVNKPEDIFQSGIGMIRLNPEYAKSISDAFQALKLPDPTPTIIAGIKTFQELSDQETSIPRIQQGQQTISTNTAFELQQRLEASGKHMGAKIRAQDRQTEWALNYELECERSAGNLPNLPPGMSVRAGGFKEFTKRVTEFQAIMSLLQLALASPLIQKRLQLGWSLHELASALSIDPEKFWKSEQEVNDQDAAQQQDPMQMIQLQAAQAALALAHAKVGSEDARAKDLLADAQLKLAQIGQQQQEAQRRRAETAHKITEDIHSRQSNGIALQRQPGGMRQKPFQQPQTNEVEQ